MGQGFTDISATGWVARAPAGWRPYLLLARLDRPIGIWLLFLPGAWGILLPRVAWGDTLRLAMLFAVGSVVMRAAGCVVNDMWDRDLDRKVARTAGRPLAAGAVSMRGAAVFLGVLLLAGLLVWTVGRLCVALDMFALGVFPWQLLAGQTILGLAAILPGVLVGAWVYKE